MFHISVSTLRHYDRIGLVQPEYTDPGTGYRYYSGRQFECLNTIRYLRALDMPLERIAVFLQNRNIDNIHMLLMEQKAEVKRRRQELAIIEKKIDNRLCQIADALSSRLDVIAVINSPARRIASVRKKLTPKSDLDLEFSIRQLERAEESTVTFLGKVGLGITKQNLQKRNFCAYDMVFLLLDEEDSFRGGTTLLPAETCVSLRFQGRHERAACYYEKMMDYIEQKKYEVAGFSKEITMIDYGLTDDTSQFVTEIQIPVSGA